MPLQLRLILILLVYALVACGVPKPPAFTIEGGFLDPSFSGDGVHTLAFERKELLFWPSANATDLLVEPSGIITIVGSTSKAASSETGIALARYTPAGQLILKTSLFPPFVSSVRPSNILPQKDGSLIVVAAVTDSENNLSKVLVRLTAEGKWDKSFGVRGQNGVVREELGDSSSRAGGVSGFSQSDGNIVVVGLRASFEGNPERRVGKLSLSRYTADGQVDLTFGDNGLSQVTLPDFYYRAFDTLIDANDDTWVLATNAAKLQTSLFKFSAEGALIMRLEPSTEASLPGDAYFRHLALQGDGKVVLVGSPSGLARYLPNGSFDTAFGQGEVAFTDLKDRVSEVSDALVQKNGGIVVVGQHLTSAVLVRYLSDGTLDDSFGNEGIITTRLVIDEDYTNFSRFNAVAEQPDAKLVASGSFNSFFLTARYE